MGDLGFAVAFKVNGRQVDPATVDDEDTREKIDAILESLSCRVNDLLCPQHHEDPGFLFSGPSFEELSIEIIGCCQSQIDLVKKCLENGKNI